MNSTKKIYFLLYTCLALLTSGCDNYLDVNNDPTLKSDATVQELLATAQFYTSDASWQQAYTACQYAQQLSSNLSTTGTDSYAEAENATGWSNFYLYILPQLNAIISKAKTEDVPVYAGIAKTLLAYNLGIATTSWENIPFSQADQEPKNFQPVYDTQQVIYADIQRLLDEAIVELTKNSGTKPGTDDLIYAGDVAKWTRLAYSLKARYLLHLSNKNTVQTAQAALTALQNGMKSNADDFQLKYNSKNLQPWYSRVALTNSTSNLSVTYSSTFVDLMNGKVQGITDPRISKVITLKNNQTVYSGQVPASLTGTTVDFSAASWHSGINSPVVFMTYAETKAIEAEARFLSNGGTFTSKGSTEDAYKAYLEIAQANMRKLEVTEANITSYLSAPAVAVTASQLTLLQILKEKYKAMFLIGDIWTDVRKYGYWDLPMPANVNPELGGPRIQRMRYPSSELTRNTANAEKNVKGPAVTMWMFSN
ncbi:SusD/RagB family nutrient-binding outer membrane lipoprotein [Dyadobacter psychrotolerans]|uniref:SusD/RagB family nutrient-binding outer membrane lipoprotein n=1 Tax=Dyadobacter psychrotolerans TaxID=2541721 RepID=A0A4R5DYJ6_9BACT|nr:SusD/RagB family nutrient-binding outer membrane lipoprotein [Dyadobacter psychrotolerans]TDE16445.1 SusD/RagB family nutrient-binding outer membrane lipoprotein [Dyadobacter psychrotolerans]